MSPAVSGDQISDAHLSGRLLLDYRLRKQPWHQGNRSGSSAAAQAAKGRTVPEGSGVSEIPCGQTTYPVRGTIRCKTGATATQALAEGSDRW